MTAKMGRVGEQEGEGALEQLITMRKREGLGVFN